MSPGSPSTSGGIPKASAISRAAAARGAVKPHGLARWLPLRAAKDPHTPLSIGFYVPGDDIRSKLESIDRDPGKIDFIITSHLHFDHAGGNEFVPNATVIVQRREWEVGMSPEGESKFGFYKADFDKGHKVKQVEGEYDVFGDGSVVCIPTYGHTPGHQSLRVRTKRGEFVLTGDACYFCRTLKERRLPARVFDRVEMLASLDRLEALERSGAKLIFGHDPEFWKSVPQGPAPLF